MAENATSAESTAFEHLEVQAGIFALSLLEVGADAVQGSIQLGNELRIHLDPPGALLSRRFQHPLRLLPATAPTTFDLTVAPSHPFSLHTLVPLNDFVTPRGRKDMSAKKSWHCAVHRVELNRYCCC